MQLGPRSTPVPSGVFIYPAVWPQDMEKNWVGWVRFFSGGSWVPIEQKVAWAEAYLDTKWYLDARSHNKNRPKTGGSAPFFGEDSWVPI